MPKASAILMAKTVNGINFPVSIALTVCLETAIRTASSAWVQSFLARSTLIEFFILGVFASRSEQADEVRQGKERHQMPEAPILRIERDNDLHDAQHHEHQKREAKGDRRSLQLDAALQLVHLLNSLKVLVKKPCKTYRRYR
jgi:hypothetical protein